MRVAALLRSDAIDRAETPSEAVQRWRADPNSLEHVKDGAALSYRFSSAGGRACRRLMRPSSPSSAARQRPAPPGCNRSDRLCSAGPKRCRARADALGVGQLRVIRALVWFLVRQEVPRRDDGAHTVALRRRIDHPLRWERMIE